MAGVPGLAEVAINFNGASSTIVAAATGKNTQILKLFLTVSVAVALTFKDNTTGLTGAMTLAAGTPFVIDESYAGIPWMTAVGDFVIAQSGAAQVSGRLVYIQE